MRGVPSLAWDGYADAVDAHRTDLRKMGWLGYCWAWLSLLSFLMFPPKWFREIGRSKAWPK